MTADAAAPPVPAEVGGRRVEGGGSGSAARVAAERWRRSRFAVAFGAAVVALAVLGVLLLPGSAGRRLDPEAAGPDGARAVAEVLQERGVDVELVERAEAAFAAAGAAAGGGATVVVVEPSLLDPALLAPLPGSAAEVVLVEPDGAVLAALDAPVVAAGGDAPGTDGDDPDQTEPGCSLDAAVAAGRATGGGLAYARADAASDADPAPAAAAEVCYGGAVAQWQDGGTRVTVIGQAGVLTNEGIADGGNATLALRVLGAAPTLVWWYADPLDGVATDDPPTTAELLPRWVRPVALQLAVVAVLAVLWRARRLGRLVPEPLPVVVRSAETSRGRAALYRRAGARDRAAAVLRADLLRRLAPRFALRPGAAATDVADGAARAAGRPAGEVHRLLLGPAPTTDRDLARLADDLDDLVRDVEDRGEPRAARMSRRTA